jgi:hypothetical protein
MLVMLWNTFKTVTTGRAVDVQIPVLTAHA